MKTRMNLFFSFLILFAFSLTAFAQNVDDPAPDFTLEDIDGNSFTLSENKGKVVFIFFFGSECDHCFANGPNTQTDIYAVYKDNPDFVAIGIDTWDKPLSSVLTYKNATKIEYRLMLNGSHVMTEYVFDYDRIAIIDTAGVLRYKSSTVANTKITAEAAGIIDDLLPKQTTNIINSVAPKKQINIAPTQVNNILNFNNPFENGEIATIEIVNLTGQLAFTSKIELSDKNTLNTETLSPGYYSILIKTKDNYAIARFIKL